MTPDFDEVFEAEFAALHRYLARRLGSAEAEDLTATTFATALSKWAELDPSRPVRPWLYGIATNLMRHYWRDERRKLAAYARTGLDPVVSDDLDDLLGKIDADARHRQIAGALRRLRDRDRELLLLHAWAELNDHELAEATGLPVGTVKSRLSRAKVKVAGAGTCSEGDPQEGSRPHPVLGRLRRTENG